MSKKIEPAFIFPGQGSQHVGMGRSLCDNFRIARDVFDEADDVLGMRLSRICFEGPVEDLNMTHNTQPAVLATSMACLRVLSQEAGLTPSACAGHSLGEITAITASDGVGFADALRLVRERGRLMEEAVPAGTGGMVALLGADRETVGELCRQASSEDAIYPANYNCPGQTVVAGRSGAIDRLMEAAKNSGIRAVRLSVGVPSHSPLMEEAARRFSEALSSVIFRDLRYSVVSNADAELYPSKEHIAGLLVKQLTMPVRWEESMRKLIDMDTEYFVEVGPGKVLCGLLKRIDRSKICHNMEEADSLNEITRIFSA